MGISFFAILYLFTLLGLAEKDNGAECDCFRTNGSSAGYFTSHQFNDYRNIESASSVAPPVLTDASANTNAPVTSDYLTSDLFVRDWTPVNWNNSDTLGTESSDATVLMINSPNNVYIEKSTDSSPLYASYLALRTDRQPNFQSVAEIDSTSNSYSHLSARFRARVIGSPGACAGMFTYLSPPNSSPQSVQEADIEILTSGPRNKVQYTNQPSNSANGDILPQATRNVTNPGNTDWTQWMTYRVDWMPGLTAWYVDGVNVANISFQVPKDPAGLIVNMWSDGGSWTGNMSVYDQAFLHIQWIEVVYNISDPVQRRDRIPEDGFLVKKNDAEGCKAVCAIDEQVDVTGTPALLYNNTGMATRVTPDRIRYLACIPVTIIGGAIFGYF